MMTVLLQKQAKVVKWCWVKQRLACWENIIGLGIEFCFSGTISGWRGTLGSACTKQILCGIISPV